MLLAFLYLTGRKIKVRDKICAVLLLVFFMLSFILRQLDYIWHGFHFTNMIPYRFSFLFSFVLLYMAYRAWLLRGSFQIWQILMGAVLCLGIFACSEELENWVFLLYSLGFLALYTGVFIYGRCIRKLPEDADEQMVQEHKAAVSYRRQLSSMLLLAVMGIEIVCNLVSFGVHFDGTSISNYPRGTTYTASVIRYMKEREARKSLFYRAETTHSQALNDGALNGYNGISAFTSSANVKVTEFMQTLGYGAKNTYNRYCHEEASPVSNLFLNLKYTIERQGKNKESSVFEKINHFGNTILLENRYYLPLGFMTEPELAELEFDVNNNGFQFQNTLLTTASGVEGDVWHILGQENFTIEGVDLTVYDQRSNGYCSYQAEQKGGTVVYTYKIDTDGFMCISVNLPKRNDVAIWVNGELRYTEATSLPQMLAVGDVVAGDVVELKMASKTAGESGTMTISAAILNEAQFAAAYDALNAATLKLTAFSNTRVEGTIDCEQAGLLYTSIPQNGNWFAEVDGEKVETLAVGDAMVALMLDEGTHEICFYYYNKAFSLGWKISLGCAAVFIALILKYRQHTGKKGKYERNKKEKH